MRAYQCDRCGKFFANSNKDTKEPWIFITGSKTSTMYIKDLCDDCQKEFEAWWMIKKEEETEEQKPGIWIDVPIGRYVLLYRCSKCLKKFVRKSKYCPDCGDKKEETDDSKRT